MSSLIDDIFAVLRPLWFILIFQILVAVAIICVPPAQDVMLVILEDSISKIWPPLIWFSLAMIFWSVTSEFGSRFILYLSDVSSHHLNPARVQRRKTIVRIFSILVLFLPITATFVGFVKVYAIHRAELDFAAVSIIIPFIVIIGILWLAYFGPLKKFFSIQSRLSPDANAIINQLSGILQERHIPVSENPKPLTFDKTDGDFLVRKPQIQHFKPLFQQLYILLAIALIIIVIFLLLGTEAYASVGSLGIIAAGFACWYTVYYAIEMLDQVQPFKIKLPYKLLMATILVTCSIVDNDHPVWHAKLKEGESLARRPSLSDHFEKWKATVKTNANKTSIDTLTVVFVAAEGGALRTGFLTAMMLAKLQQCYPDITKRMYAFSSVSGGTLGANFFNALSETSSEANAVTITRSFFEEDYLAPATGKLAFGEITNYFLPRRFKRFDREYALEHSWELGFKKITGKNLLATSFDSVYITNHKTHRALFIHSTQVENGKRAIYSNVSIDPQTFPNALDVYGESEAHLRYSSVIGLSTRFPLVSPAGALGNPMFHFVDGGYYENRGATTLREVIQSLKSSSPTVIIPHVILFAFGDDCPAKGGKKTADEIVSVLDGIYNVRGGHTDHATELLLRSVGQRNFTVLTPPRNTPMNWVFSNAVVSSVIHHCDWLIEKNRPRFDSLTQMIKRY